MNILFLWLTLVYSDSQPQVIKFTSCLSMVGGSLGIPSSSSTKTGRHDIAEILLKMALNTINKIK